MRVRILSWVAVGVAAACGSFDGADNDKGPGSSGSSGTSPGPAAGADASGDAFVTVGSDGGSPLSPDAARPALRCGKPTLVCKTTPCCVEQNGSSSSQTWDFRCNDPCPTKANTATLECTDISSCSGGQVCCISITASHATATCQTSCTAPAKQLCDPNVAGSKECGTGKVCSTSNMDDFFLDSSYGQCKSTEA